MQRSYEKENNQYRKLMQEEKDFHTQNLTRVKKEKQPPMDKMIILDADNNEV